MRLGHSWPFRPPSPASVTNDWHGVLRLTRRPRPGLGDARHVLPLLVAALLTGPNAAAPQNLQAIPAPVMSRDGSGRPTVRATGIADDGLRLDGNLDEDVYRVVPSFGDFIQGLPQEGSPATERTDVWVLFDRDNLYIAARCWDSAPSERWVANEMRRDLIGPNDNFSVVLDTFHDRRNGYMLQTNPLGARSDVAFTDEGSINRDWNPVWDVRTGLFEGGWTLEMVIPFKSLRYVSGSSQTWGIQIRRLIRHKNEWTYLAPVPKEIGGPPALARISLSGDLVSLDLPEASRNLELKPYAISGLTTDRIGVPPLRNEPSADAGFDVKYGITANLTADVTYNTDFAQVEVDEQQVNLTRFSLFFPEKRDFFLEGRGIFDFGRSAPGGNTPSLFYSRRVGLNRNRVVPLRLGGRLTGKAGPLSLGVMNIQTDDESVSRTPDTNFTVVRVKRDILRRSAIGMIATNRSRSNVADGSNQAYGVDSSFSFFQNLTMDAYLARTRTPRLTGDDTSYQGRFEFAPDRYGVRVEHLYVGDNFNPEVGFVRRDNLRRSFALARFSPRPQSIRSVRKFTWEASLEYIVNGSGTLESRRQLGRFNTEFENSDQFTVDVSRNYELLIRPFTVSPGVSIPGGGYRFADAQVTYTFGEQRRASGALAFQTGQFYDGTIRSLALSSGRLSITNQLSVEPSFALNHVELPAGNFTTRLFQARSDFSFTPRMLASALVQYGSTDGTFSSNLRFRWEYIPGSEVFAVYTDERDTTARGFPLLRNRAFVVKINRLFRF